MLLSAPRTIGVVLTSLTCAALAGCGERGGGGSGGGDADGGRADAGGGAGPDFAGLYQTTASFGDLSCDAPATEPPEWPAFMLRRVGTAMEFLDCESTDPATCSTGVDGPTWVVLMTEGRAGGWFGTEVEVTPPSADGPCFFEITETAATGTPDAIEVRTRHRGNAFDELSATDCTAAMAMSRAGELVCDWSEGHTGRRIAP